MWPAVVAGGALGLGAGFAQGESARSAEKQAKAQNRSLEQVMRAAFQNDPLWNMILGSMAQNRGAPWNPEEMYERGLEQLGYVRQRREFDALRELSARGFGGQAGQQQQQFASRSLGQQEAFERGGLRDLVDQTTVQARQEELLGGFDAFSQLLAQRMGIGASLGILGELAPRGPGAGGALGGLSQGGLEGLVPEGLQGSFWVQ